METHESFRILFPPLDGTGIDGLGARWSEPEQGNGSSAVLLAHGAHRGVAHDADGHAGAEPAQAAREPGREQLVAFRHRERGFGGRARIEGAFG